MAIPKEIAKKVGPDQIRILRTPRQARIESEAAAKEKRVPFDPDNYDPNNPDDLLRFQGDLEIETTRKTLLKAQGEKHQREADGQRYNRLLDAERDLKEIGIDHPSQEMIERKADEAEREAHDWQNY